MLFIRISGRPAQRVGNDVKPESDASAIHHVLADGKNVAGIGRRESTLPWGLYQVTKVPAPLPRQ